MKNVVIIDDNEAFRLVLSSLFFYLYKAKIQTFTAEDGVKGLGYVFISRPGLIVIDLTLPEYSGREVIDFLSSNNFILEHKTPVIVLTENKESGDLPDHFICINKSSKGFIDTFSACVAAIFQIKPQVSWRTRLFKFISNKLINHGNRVDVVQESSHNTIQKILNAPLLLLLNLEFSFFVALFFVFFASRHTETNLDLKDRDYNSFRTRAYPAVAMTIASISLVFLQLSAVGGIGLTALLRGFTPVYAASYTWDGGGDDLTCGGAVGDGNKWSCALNWSGDVVPTALDTVTFNGTSTKDAVVDAAFGGVVTSVSINAGYTGTITLQRSLQTTSTFTQAAGTFTASSQTLDIDSTLTISAGSFTASSGTTFVGGALTISGAPTFNANGGTFTFDNTNGVLACNNVAFSLVTFNNINTKTVNSDCNLPMGNNPTITGTGNITVNGTLSGTGTLTRETGTITMNTGSSFSGFTGLSLNTFTVAGATLNLSGYTAFSTASTLTVSSGSLALPTGADLNGNTAISGGTFTAPAGNMTVNGNLIISGTGVFNANGGTVTLDGTQFSSINCNGTSLSNVVVAATGSATKTFSNCPSVPLGNDPSTTRIAVTNSTLSGTGTLTMAGGGDSTFIAGAALSGFTGISAQGFTVNGANLNLSGYSSFVQGPAGNTLSVISGSLALPNGADINGNLTISGGTFTAPSGTLNLAANMTISGSPTFNANGGTINFDSGTGGTLSCNNVTFNQVNFTHTINTKFVNANCTLPIGANPSISFSVHLSGALTGSGTIAMGAGSTLTYNGTSASLTGFSGLTTGSMVVQNNAVLNIGSYTTFTNTSSFTQSSGIVTLPDGADLNGLLIISGGTFNAPSGSMTLASNLTVSGSPTFNANGGNFIVDGVNGILTCNNIVFNLFTFAHNANLKTVGSSCNLPLGNNPSLGAGGTAQVTLNGTLTGTGTITTFGQLTLNAGATLTGFSQFIGGAATGVSILNSGATSNFSSFTSFVTNGSISLTSGTLSLPSGTQIDSSNGLTITGGIFNAPTGVMNLAGTLSISGSPVFNANGGTINADGTADATWTCNGATFNLVTFNHTGSGIRTMGTNCNIPLGNNPTLTGRIRLNAASATVSGSGLFTSTCEQSGCLRITSGNFTGFSGLIAYGNVTVDGGTLNLSNYSPVQIFGRNSSQSLGIVGGTVTAPSGVMQLYDVLNMQGTFNHNGGTVEFLSEAADTTVGISAGSVTFHNLISNIVIPTYFWVPAGSTQTVLGTFGLQGGGTGSLLSLISLTPGTQWNLDASNAVGIDIEYLSVTDSNSLNRIINTAGLNMTNGGNNTNWNFANPEVSNLGPTSLINGSYITDSTPKFTFRIVDPQSTDQVRYQVQIDNNSDYSSPEKDKTSDPAAQGNLSFTPKVPLEDGHYYWRVRGFDTLDGISPYSSANNGAKAFTLDTTPPTGNIVIRDSGATNPLTVRLLTPAFDTVSGVNQMMISETLSFSGAAWENYTTSRNYTFSSAGHKTVYVKYRDRANHESYAYAASVVIILPKPTEPNEPPPDTGVSQNLDLYDVLVKIVDKNNKPLQGAVVSLSPAAKKIVAQSDGSYRFENATPGEHIVIIEYAGTRTESKVKLVGTTKEIVIKIVIEAQEPQNIFAFNIWICGGSISLVLFALIVLGILIWRRDRKQKKKKRARERKYAISLPD